MLPIYMIQSQVFWLRGKPLRNIQPFNGFAPMQDIERLLNKMFPKNSALVLILLHARKLDGRFYLSGGLWSVLWPGSTIPAVFPKTMKCLSVLHKLFAPLLPSALYSSGFSLLVQLLTMSLLFIMYLHNSLIREFSISFQFLLYPFQSTGAYCLCTLINQHLANRTIFLEYTVVLLLPPVQEPLCTVWL